jgi:chitosanase
MHRGSTFKLACAAGVIATLLLTACSSGESPSAPPVTVTKTQTTTAPTAPATHHAPNSGHGQALDLTNPRMKELALELVSTAENSTRDWRAHFDFIKNEHDKRGYTAGIMGYCSGTGDMMEVVKHYQDLKPGNILAQYLPALHKLNRIYAHHDYENNPASASVTSLGDSFVTDWKTAAQDPLFQQAQEWERDKVYFNPAVVQAKKDGLHALGQFVYFDTAVNMGGVKYSNFHALRHKVLKVVELPSQGGNEATYLREFQRIRVDMMGDDYGPTDRVRVQLQFLREHKLNLQVPLKFRMYSGDYYDIPKLPPAGPN